MLELSSSARACSSKGEESGCEQVPDIWLPKCNETNHSKSAASYNFNSSWEHLLLIWPPFVWHPSINVLQYTWQYYETESSTHIHFSIISITCRQWVGLVSPTYLMYIGMYYFAQAKKCMRYSSALLICCNSLTLEYATPSLYLHNYMQGMGKRDLGNLIHKCDKLTNYILEPNLSADFGMVVEWLASRLWMT